MKLILKLSLSLLIVTCSFLVIEQNVQAATLLVGDLAATDDGNPINCGDTSNPCNTITNGIAAATAGDTLQISTGTFVENIIIDKPLTLQGAGVGKTILYPATSSPTCSNSSPASLCGGIAVNVILVASQDVTIMGLTVDGDNPALTSGIVLGGADIDARNGIITDNTQTPTFDNLQVTNTLVKNVYFRGIYASNGGTFNIHDNTVQNVQGDGASIGIYNFGGFGVIRNNDVSETNDAISANWSLGTQILNNQITKSASGIHTDNAGGTPSSPSQPTPSPDLIQGNQVSACTSLTGTYGIFVYAPYIAPLVNGNTVSGCDVGLAVFGEGNLGVKPIFSNNLSSSNTTGFQMTTDLGPAGSRNVSAILTSNNFIQNKDGIFLQSQPSQILALNGSFNRIAGNTNTGVTLDSVQGIYQVNLPNNWWGCNLGPNAPSSLCDSIEGATNFSPWLTLSLDASPTSIYTDANSFVKADLTHNSDKQNTSSLGNVLDGILISFTTDLGSIGVPPNSQPTSSGISSTLFDASGVTGTANVTATLDQESISTPILIQTNPNTLVTPPSSPATTPPTSTTPSTITPATVPPLTSPANSAQGGGGCSLIRS